MMLRRGTLIQEENADVFDKRYSSRERKKKEFPEYIFYEMCNFDEESYCARNNSKYR